MLGSQSVATGGKRGEDRGKRSESEAKRCGRGEQARRTESLVVTEGFEQEERGEGWGAGRRDAKEERRDPSRIPHGNQVCWASGAWRCVGSEAKNNECGETRGEHNPSC